MVEVLIDPQKKMKINYLFLITGFSYLSLTKSFIEMSTRLSMRAMYGSKSNINEAKNEDETNGEIDGKKCGKRRERVKTTVDRRWEVKPIGVVESPYIDKFGTPKQATISARDGGKRNGLIRLYPEYYGCMKNLDGFDYIWVITLMHLNDGFKVLQ